MIRRFALLAVLVCVAGTAAGFTTGVGGTYGELTDQESPTVVFDVDAAVDAPIAQTVPPATPPHSLEQLPLEADDETPAPETVTGTTASPPPGNHSGETTNASESDGPTTPSNATAGADGSAAAVSPDSNRTDGAPDSAVGDPTGEPAGDGSGLPAETAVTTPAEERHTTATEDEQTTFTEDDQNTATETDSTPTEGAVSSGSSGDASTERTGAGSPGTPDEGR